MAIIMVTAIGILIAGLVFLVLVRKKRRLSQSQAMRIASLWTRVEHIPDLRLKIVEADKILDEALKLLGYAGPLGDKLKKAGPRFSDINSVWFAHKLRNRAAHELNFAPAIDETNRAMRVYKKALAELGMR